MPVSVYENHGYEGVVPGPLIRICLAEASLLRLVKNRTASEKKFICNCVDCLLFVRWVIIAVPVRDDNNALDPTHARNELTLLRVITIIKTKKTICNIGLNWKLDFT